MNHRQGLTFANGILYESTGLYGHSKVRILDPSTGETQKSINLDPKFFAEGMTYWKGKLIQITWKSQQGFVYNATTLEQIEYFQFNTTENEGWGITYDWCKDEFIVTDGSPFLHFWNPKNLKEKRKIQVKRMNGSPAKELNEIEYWRGRLLVSFSIEIAEAVPSFFSLNSCSRRIFGMKMFCS
jgi:glutamine cyclotransferase